MMTFETNNDYKEEEKTWKYAKLVVEYFKEIYGEQAAKVIMLREEDFTITLKEVSLLDYIDDLFSATPEDSPTENAGNIHFTVKEILQKKHLKHIIETYQISKEDAKYLKEFTSAFLFFKKHHRGIEFYIKRSHGGKSKTRGLYYEISPQDNSQTILYWIQGNVSPGETISEVVIHGRKEKEVEIPLNSAPEKITYPEDLSFKYLHDLFASNLEDQNILKELLETDFTGKLQLQYTNKNNKTVYNIDAEIEIKDNDLMIYYKKIYAEYMRIKNNTEIKFSKLEGDVNYSVTKTEK